MSGASVVSKIIRLCLVLSAACVATEYVQTPNCSIHAQYTVNTLYTDPGIYTDTPSVIRPITEIFIKGNLIRCTRNRKYMREMTNNYAWFNNSFLIAGRNGLFVLPGCYYVMFGLLEMSRIIC